MWPEKIRQTELQSCYYLSLQAIRPIIEGSLWWKLPDTFQKRRLTGSSNYMFLSVLRHCEGQKNILCFLCEKQIKMKDGCQKSSLKKVFLVQTSVPGRLWAAAVTYSSGDRQRQKQRGGRHKTHETSRDFWRQTTHGNKYYTCLQCLTDFMCVIENPAPVQVLHGQC